MLSQNNFVSSNELGHLIILIICKQIKWLKAESYALSKQALQNLHQMFYMIAR